MDPILPKPARLLGALAAAAAVLPAAATTDLPVRELTALERGSLSGMPYTEPANHAFRMAAAVTVSAYDKDTEARTIPQTKVQRSNGAQAAVYQGVPLKLPTPPLLPTLPAGNSLFDFIDDGDHTQGWATMSASGVPHLWVRGFGGFAVDATASWATTLTVPAGGTREVVVRFVIPPAVVSGATEQDSVQRWRAKLRSELLVNGFPAWHGEALRLTVDPKIVSNNLQETLVLQQFGTALSFPTDDEDDSPSNNSTVGSMAQPSAARTVYLTLGRFNAGHVIDLSMIHRASAMTVPAVAGGSEPKCRWDIPQARYFCSRGGVSLDGSAGGAAPRIYFLP